MIKRVHIDDIRENEKNPKTIDWYKLEQLKTSMKEFPDMLEVRPIVVNKDGVIIGGNMRWKAAKELGWSEITVRFEEEGFKEDEFIIKDNLSYGDWNWEGLKLDFSSDQLLDWGLDVPLFFRDEAPKLDVESVMVEEGEVVEKGAELKPTSTKKALYLFYSVEQKEEILNKLKYIDGDCNEVRVIRQIQKFLE